MIKQRFIELLWREQGDCADSLSSRKQFEVSLQDNRRNRQNWDRVNEP